MEQTFYKKELDYSFGLRLLQLREKAGLTQTNLAGRLGLSEKAIRNWEAGLSYPSGPNLQKLIEVLVLHQAFSDGQEKSEAVTLWEHSAQHSSRRQSLFDEGWFESLLAQTSPLDPPSSNMALVAPTSKTRTDWGEALVLSNFWGREDELASLQKTLLDDRYQVVTLLGMGGIGKTALATQLSRQLAPRFEAVLWRTLRNALPFENFLVDAFNLLAPGTESVRELPELEKSLARLLELLREQRCLIVLDNLETILQPGTGDRRFRPGYEGYGLLLSRLAQDSYQSCLVLTSRELPLELETLEVSSPHVQSVKLRGLDNAACYELLRAKNLHGQSDDWENLTRRYSYNPLALKIVAESVQELFGGDIAAFLAQGQLGFDDVLSLLRQQFQRLSETAMSILYCLAIERDLVTLEELYKLLRGTLTRGAILDTLKTLGRCCLIERGEQGGTFTLQPVVMECVTEQLLEGVYQEIINSTPNLLLRHPLLKAQTKEYLRHSQARLIIKPLLERLLAQFGSKERVQEQLLALAHKIRTRPYLEQGYSGGNILNLLVNLRSSLRGLNLAGLVIWQAYLQGVEAQDADFSHCDFSDSVLIEAFDSISAVALSHDGKYLAMGSFNGHLQVWQLSDAKPLLLFTSYGRTAWSLAFSPDGQYLASAGYEQSVRLWKMSGEDRGQCVLVLTGHSQWLRSLAFSPDGSKIVAAGNEGVARIWEVGEGRCISVLRGHKSTIWSVAFTPDGKRVATGSDDSTVCLWDVESGECRQTIEPAGGGWVWSVAISPDGQYLAVGIENGDVRIWDFGRQSWCANLTGHNNWVWSLSFDADGQLASGSHDGLVKIWDVASATCQRTLSGHTNRIWSVSSGPNGLLASGGHDGLIKLWNSRNGQCLQTLQGYTRAICSVAFSPNGQFLLGGNDNGTLRLWDVANGQCLRSWQPHIGRIWALSFSPTAHLFASAGGDRSVRIWDTASGQCLKKLTGHLGEIWSVAWSSDERYLASCSLDRRVRIWEVETGKCLHIFSGHHNWVWAVAFSHNGRFIASSAADGEIKIWDTATGTCLHTIFNGSSPAGSLAFTPDSKSLLTSSNDGSLKVWNVESAALERSRPGHTSSNWTRSVAFSSDASLVAIGSDDRSTKVWTTAPTNSHSPQQTLKGHSSGIWSVSFTTDNRYVASGSDDGTIILWDIEKGQQLHILRNDRPYERTLITGATGLTEAQRQSLKELGVQEI